MHLSPWPRASPGQRPSQRLWSTSILCSILALVTINILLHYRVPTLLFSCALSSAHSWISNATDSEGPWSGAPWRYPGHQEPGYWLNEFQDTLDTMQEIYWNGTYWPSTIQWIGAFMNTLVAASERSFTDALEDYDGEVPGTGTTAKSISAEIDRYFSGIEAYYGGEDTIQIFGAAYDDAQWVVLEWLEAIKFIKQFDEYANSTLGRNDIARFAHRAHLFYNIVQDKFDTSLCEGGINWNPALATYKNAITNELFITSSIGMYLYYPGDNNSSPYPSPIYGNVTNSTLIALPPLAAHDPVLLENAQKEYEWFKTHNFTDAQGLIVDGFHISENQTTCDERNEMVYTYNQGVIQSGLRGLWEATGDSTYLSDGYALIETVINATGWFARSRSDANRWAGLGRNGIMEDYCDAPANCSQDAQMFKGIYFHHLGLFCEPLPTTMPLVPGVTKLASSALAQQHASTCAGYIPWIEHNAYAALSSRNGSGIVGGWWGASYENKTQGPQPEYAVALPQGSSDEWNQPWILEQPPWACDGQHGCNDSKRRIARTMASLFRSRKRRSGPYVGNVQTEASGLGVVKAANDFTMRQMAA